MTSDTKDVSKDEPNCAEPNSLNSTSSTISSVVLPHSVQRSFSGAYQQKFFPLNFDVAFSDIVFNCV